MQRVIGRKNIDERIEELFGENIWDDVSKNVSP